MSSVVEARSSHAEASRRLMRDSVLDAVGELLAQRAWTDVTMAAVAGRAGVSRQTLYNAFGNREELAQAYLMREAERFLAAIEDAVVSNADDPRRALTQAAELFLSLVSTHPMVRAISTQEGEQLVAMATTRGGALLGGMTDRLSELILANWPTVDPDGARLLAATLVRLAISHAVLPTGAPKRTAADIARILGPFIDELLTELSGAEARADHAHPGDPPVARGEVRLLLDLEAALLIAAAKRCATRHRAAPFAPWPRRLPVLHGTDLRREALRPPLPAPAPPPSGRPGRGRRGGRRPPVRQGWESASPRCARARRAAPPGPPDRRGRRRPG